MLTPFGKVVRKLRIDRSETLKDMAEALEVPSSYLSALEMGRKNLTDEMINRVIEHFCADKQLAAEIRHAGELSRTHARLDMQGASNEQRELATMFARTFKELDKTDISEFLRVLRAKHEGTT